MIEDFNNEVTKNKFNLGDLVVIPVTNQGVPVYRQGVVFQVYTLPGATGWRYTIRCMMFDRVQPGDHRDERDYSVYYTVQEDEILIFTPF